MEGRFAAPTLQVRRRLPSLCAFSFLLGATMEYIMCSTGFYHVYNVKQGQRESAKERDAEDFWIRVNATREAKRAAANIRDD